MSTEVETKKDDDDDDFSWGGCITIVVLVVAAAWALIHFNPSEEKHEEKIAEVLIECMADGHYLSGSGVKAMNNLKYHSIGIASWTTSKYHGRTVLVTVGALGYVYPFFDVD